MDGTDLGELKGKTARASALLKALANECRLRVMCELAAGERSVGEIQRAVGLGQSALSQHLARLRKDELVASRRSAQTVYYRIASPEVLAIMATLHALYCADPPAETVGA